VVLARNDDDGNDVQDSYKQILAFFYFTIFEFLLKNLVGFGTYKLMLTNAKVAQLAERWICNKQVVGTDCTPGSAPGPMLSNEYGKPLPFNANAVCN